MGIVASQGQELGDGKSLISGGEVDYVSDMLGGVPREHAGGHEFNPGEESLAVTRRASEHGQDIGRKRRIEKGSLPKRLVHRVGRGRALRLEVD